MQAYSTTTDLKHYHHHQNSQQDNDDEGFAQMEVQSLIVPKRQAQDDLQIHKPRARPKVLYRQPKLKLTFLGKEKNHRDQLRKSILSKQERSMRARSFDAQKNQSKKNLQLQIMMDCVAKIKRTVVANNISIPTFSLADSKAIRTHIISSGNPLVYQQPKQINTHGYLRTFLQQSSTFIDSDFNQLLRMKLKESFIMPKKIVKNSQNKAIEFQADYQNANLQFVSQIGQNQFQLYLKNDTNTHGHQSWFCFKIKNTMDQGKSVNLNMCNLKRNLTMFTDGAKIYTRKVSETGNAISQWTQSGINYQFRSVSNAKFSNVRVYRLTFDLHLEAQSAIEVSLIPAYNYTDMLNDVKQAQQQCKYLICSTLTFSLVGLAIPLLTFTRGNQPHKQVILISCRIHPGQTNSSFMCRGFIRWLTEDTPIVREFLQKNIVKVVPMINPDGVLFGNFRTNFLGADLNRCFDRDDEVTNPEVSALKELGHKLKQQHGELFNLFLDLHGHSSQKNIFTYGPDYDTQQMNYYTIRLLPKILNLRSKMFKYYYCSFKLQDYKRSTARGYFLNNIGTLAYTIEASYAFYQDQNKLWKMGPKQWTEFGGHLAQGLSVLSKINKLSTIRSKIQIKKALGQADQEQVNMIKRFKKQFKAQKQSGGRQREKVKDKGGEDSDGENDCEDYNRAEKEEVIRRVAETVAPNLILPRVLKPAIIYPTVTPKLFKYRQEPEQNQLKILYTRRTSKYGSLRMPGNSYINSLRGIQTLKPESKNPLF